MISFFVGVPGSGKTYYAVDKIYNNFSTDKEAKKDKHTFDCCYTNINEFDFEKLQNVFKLDFDELKKHLTKLHKLYKDKNEDEILIDYCKENNIYNALFVIDEAHNFFDTRDTVLTWWLSYHRHLYHEIILITQNLALVDSKYKSFSEFFYRAVPTSLNLFKSHFKYNQYIDSRMSMKGKTSSFKLKKNPKVFELYKSGDTIKASNIILKILSVSLFLIVLLFFYFKFFVLSDYEKEPEKVSVPATVTPLHQKIEPIQNSKFQVSNVNEDIIIDYSEKQFFILSCSLKNCVNKDLIIPYALLQNFIKTKDIKVLYRNNLSKSFFKYYCESSSTFYTFLTQSQNKGATNENPNTDIFHAPNLTGK